MKFIYFFLLISAIFSAWLMWHTFSYDQDNHSLLISAKAYSDFGSLIPLIRYFPYGLNWPIEHPLFPGEPIRYHFLFYVTVGFLQSLGLPIDFALNLPSSIGFFSLIFLLYYFSYHWLRNSRLAVLPIIFLLFNSSLSFVDFFTKYSLWDMARLTNFVSFRPWNSSQIAAFWTLNIYTNQRHLAFSFAVCLLIIISIYLKTRYLKWAGFLLGSLLFLNQAVFFIAAVVILFSFLFLSELRKPLLLSLIKFIPWLLIYKFTFSLPALPVVQFGFLSDTPTNLVNIIKFWFFNYGLSFILIVPGLIFAPIRYRPLTLALCLIFILSNILRFSPDIINNHKFFNFVFILFSVYITSLLVHIPRSISLIIFPLIILGGIIDFFPIVNDYFISIPDNPANYDVKFFSTLPKRSIVLNSTWFYNPASLAGLAIYNGYPYFTWSYGYNQGVREEFVKLLFASDNPCSLLSKTNISYIELSPNHETFIKPSSFFYNIPSIYENIQSGLKVFSVKNICSNQ